ncbi:MAG: hypothetical protein ABI881_10285 [Betaproteobacteria bacterium]
MRNVARLVIATALLFCMGTAGAQFIRNGTLDTNANGWNLSSSCGDAVWDGGAGNPPGAIRLNSCGQGDSDPTAAQTISNLVIGATYTVSVDVQLFADSSGDGTGKSFGIFLNNAPGNPLALNEFLDNSWHTVTTSFTATSGSATLFFAAELDARTPGGPGLNTDVAYNIDNIVVSGPVAAPVTVPVMSNSALVMVALLLAACAGVIIRARQKRTRG